MDVFNLTIGSVFYIELICTLLATIYFYKYRSSPLSWLLVILYLTCIIEGICIFYGVGHDNRWLFNVLSFAEFVLVSYIFYSVDGMERFKKMITILSVVFVSATLVEGFVFTTPYFAYYLSYSFGLASVFISLYCLLYFWQLVRSEKVLNFYRSLVFWVAIGLLFYHLCNLPITVLTNELMVISSSNSLLIIQAVLSIIMYISFSIGFIWSKKQYNT